MNPNLLLPIALTFIAVALASGSVTSMLLARTAPERRRLTPVQTDKPRTSLMSRIIAALRPPVTTAQLAKRPGNPSMKMSRLERRLEAAGWRDPEAASYYTAATIGLPILFAFTALVLCRLPGVAARRDGGRDRLPAARPPAGARDPRVSEVDSERPARRAGPDRRLRGSRIEPRSGNRASQRGARDRAARARAGAAHGHRRNPGRQAPSRSVSRISPAARSSKTCVRWWPC